MRHPSTFLLPVHLSMYALEAWWDVTCYSEIPRCYRVRMLLSSSGSVPVASSSLHRSARPSTMST